MNRLLGKHWAIALASLLPRCQETDSEASYLHAIGWLFSSVFFQRIPQGIWWKCTVEKSHTIHDTLACDKSTGSSTGWIPVRLNLRDILYILSHANDTCITLCTGSAPAALSEGVILPIVWLFCSVCFQMSPQYIALDLLLRRFPEIEASYFSVTHITYYAAMNWSVRCQMPLKTYVISCFKEV